MFKQVVTILVALSVLMGSTTFVKNICAESGAIGAAEAWLKLVDEGQYTQSWEQASDYFKAIMRQEAWINSIRPLRESLGKVIIRKYKSHEFATAMPGAPDGEYVVIRFETSFENKKVAIETVTPMADTDGMWRVSGYYIK